LRGSVKGWGDGIGVRARRSSASFFFLHTFLSRARFRADTRRRAEAGTVCTAARLSGSAPARSIACNLEPWSARRWTLGPVPNWNRLLDWGFSVEPVPTADPSSGGEGALDRRFVTSVRDGFPAESRPTDAACVSYEALVRTHLLMPSPPAPACRRRAARAVLGFLGHGAVGPSIAGCPDSLLRQFSPTSCSSIRVQPDDPIFNSCSL